MSPDKPNLPVESIPAKETESELYRRWDLPDVTVESLEERELALNIRHKPEPQEIEEEQAQSLTMTAEVLEEIRQSAYQEGLEQGHQEGFSKGKEEGLEAGFKEGKAQGVDAGHQEGLARGQAEIEERATRLDALMRLLHEPQQQIDSQVEQELVELTEQLARAVVHHELQTNPAILLQTLKEAIDLLPFQQQTVRIQLNPADQDLIQQTYSDDQIEQRGWRLEAEPALAMGDLRLLTEQSDISIHMQQRMNKVSQQFLAQLHQFNEPQTATPLTSAEPAINGGPNEPVDK